MRRCLRRVKASFLVSSTFWVDFFTSPCGFLENILPPPAPSRPGPRGKWMEWAGKRLARAAHPLRSLAGRSTADHTRLAPRLPGPSAPAPIWRIPSLGPARSKGDPVGRPPPPPASSGRLCATGRARDPEHGGGALGGGSTTLSLRPP